MAKRRRIWIGAAAAVLAVLVLAALAWRASRQVPEFYRAAIAQPVPQAAEASDELTSHVATLFNDVRRTGAWQAVFTADQLNAWLTVDLAKKHKRLLPDYIREPRVVLAPDRFTIAFGYETPQVSTVLSLECELYLSGPSEVGLRIRKVRAGNLPLPLSDVIGEITKLAQQLELDLKWAQQQGDPVALITFHPPGKRDDRTLWLEALELHAGELYLAGRTVTAAEARRLRQEASPPRDSAAGEKATRQ